MSSTTVRLPIVGPKTSAKEVFVRMKNANVSAAVYEEHGVYYLVEAGSAFVAWKRDAAWQPSLVGLRLESGKVTRHALGTEGMINIVPARPALGFRIAAGPSVCYCLQCESPGRPGRCIVCGGQMGCE